MKVIKIILNADDFGKNERVNKAIIKCFSEGFLTSASILMNGSNYFEAIEFMKTHRYFSIGIHLNLTEGKPVTSDRNRIPCLINKHGSFLDYWKFRKKCMKFTIPYSQIYTELENQILKFLDYGMKPTHIDSHYHTHTIPLVAIVITKLAREYGIPKIRLSLDYPQRLRINHQNYSPFRAKLAYKKIINSYFKRHFITPDYFLGSFLNQINSPKFLKALPAKAYEFSCHPNLYGFGKEELRALLDKNILFGLSDLNIKTISFNEL